MFSIFDSTAGFQVRISHVVAYFLTTALLLLDQTGSVWGQQDASETKLENSPKAKIIAKQLSEADGSYKFEIEFQVNGETLSIEDIDLEDGADGTLGKLIVTANHIQAIPVTFAIADFDEHHPIHQYTFGFAGYQDADGKQFKKGNELSFERSTVRRLGMNRSNATSGVVDTSELEIPDSASTNFLGCAVGMNLTASEDISKIDLSRIEVSFDAKVKGCKPLKHTKVLIGFLVDKGRFPAGANGPVNGGYDDVICKLIRGNKDEKDLLTITNEFQNFRFNLDQDFGLLEGQKEDIRNVRPQRMSFILQAAGQVEDTGLDDDNAVIVDNVHFRILPETKKAKKKSGS